MSDFSTIRDQLTAPGSPLELRDIEVRGVPMREYVNAPATMRDVWAMARAHGDALYVVYEDEHYTYAQVDEQVRALAHVLRTTCGVEPGDRVAVAMRNYPEWIVAYWAIVSVGAAVVGMNAWWTPQEMVYGLNDSQPKLLIADGERVGNVVQVLDELRAERPLPIVAVRHEGELPTDAWHWNDIVDPASAPATMPEVAIDPDDDATIFYTSGTTGFPKGAQLTHRGSVTNLMNLAFMQAWSTAVLQARHPELVEEADPNARAVSLAPTPLFHVTACNCGLHPITLTGGTIVLMYKWDAGRALELIEREKINRSGGVPVMSRELLAHPDFEKRDVSSLVSLSGGGAQLQPDLVEKIGAKGRTPGTGYGLTETHGIVTAVSAKFFADKPESCGPIVPTLDSKLVDDEGNDLAPGPDVIGQLCVRGSVVIKGYLNKAEATADAIRDGWFNTGDIARIDEEGFVFIVDRAKDMVLRGGENIYCSEVESALFEHPDVIENVVFGVPDQRLGEIVGACVVTAPGVTLSESDLAAFVGERLAKFKVPERWWFRTESLPRNANGKFLKRQVKAELLAD
jgi:acyl-CoA synthetase (AMP-forming)/AMP-acid ligase II